MILRPPKPVAALSAMWCFWAISAEAAMVTLPRGTGIKLVAIQSLSSKTNVKGDMVQLSVAEDVKLGGKTLIPAGTSAIGQVIDARAKGAMGMNGHLTLRPLYLQIDGRTVRLTGAQREKGSTEAGAVVGLVVLSPGFTGRSAAIPAGTVISAMVEKSVAFEQ